ncbi:MAG: DUF502 domain-containing protein [Planctomycetia bacterium]|jgi:uncharacterized membrane protein
MDNKSTKVKSKKPKKERPFRAAVVRGLGVVLPPLMTIVIFLWVGGTVNTYVLEPITGGLRDVIAWQFYSEIREDVPPEQQATKITSHSDPNKYYQMPDHSFVPVSVYKYVQLHHGNEPIPDTSKGLYKLYVERRFLSPYIVVPAFLALFILVLYLLGKFMAAGLGRFAVRGFERGVNQLPLIRNVYSSVKQVSDFLFSPREVEYTRVVAVEYPRKGIWSLGMVTGDSMLDLHAAANEPVISVLIPTSPMPVTGYTVNVRRSEAIDLDITIDQAFQFIVSCGVVVPPHQMHEAIEAHTKKLAEKEKANGMKTLEAETENDSN